MEKIGVPDESSQSGILRRQRSFFDPTTDRSSVDLGKLGSPIYIYIYILLLLFVIALSPLLSS